MAGKHDPTEGFGEGYQDLLVWQKAMECTVMLFEEVRALPEDEASVIVEQLTGAAIRVPARIADGHGRTNKRETAECLGQARGSLFELETCVIICKELGFWSEETEQTLLSQTARICKMLDGMLNQIDTK